MYQMYHISPIASDYYFLIYFTLDFEVSMKAEELARLERHLKQVRACATNSVVKRIGIAVKWTHDRLAKHYDCHVLCKSADMQIMVDERDETTWYNLFIVF